MKELVSSAATADDLRLLHVDIDTGYVMAASGRIERVNDPDRSSAPRAFLTGCPFGNIARVRYDVDDRIARRVLEVAAKEPPWRDPDVVPGCVGGIVELLSGDKPAEAAQYLIYKLPNGLRYERSAAIVRGDSAEGHEMLARFAERGMPNYMHDAGFKGVGDFWEPWCVALDGEQVASMCFAARLGKMGAEAGVYTFAKYRGQGLAAAVTVAWSSTPSLNRRALFYSTSMSNRSSQRVAARLGLRLIGASVSIG
ncbi:MAG TPA: GNAT family N-acetyltransferase [Candidatus Acidoferrum sp.]|nr:GNAT family N-acetyltransferase [Candidatus Acidoferrum sp.]